MISLQGSADTLLFVQQHWSHLSPLSHTWSAVRTVPLTSPYRFDIASRNAPEHACAHLCLGSADVLLNSLQTKPVSTALSLFGAGDSDSWEYAHRCSGAWQLIRPTIINDTHAAVQAWAAASNYTLPSFTPGDTVIQSRCSRETLLVHDEFGPVAFSYYSNIKTGAKNIFIVTDPRVKYRACVDIHAAQVKWLKQKFPSSNVKVIGGSLEHDFLRLMLAPVLFKDAQSSFGLWAGMANKGEVWSVPLLTRFTNNPSPDFGNRWHWSDAPVLYPEVARAANISRHDVKAIIDWLTSH